MATAFAALAAEAFLRLCVEQETKRLAIYDRELGWRGRPHGQGIYIRHRDGIRVPFSYNNYGFRDEDIEAKPPNARRVLMLGDSFVENLEVQFEDVFHERLEERLAQFLAEPTEVVALASQGYSNAQELQAFRRYGEIIAADLVISIFYTGNDFEDNTRRQFAYLDHDGQLQLPENPDSALKVRARKFQRWLYESSHLVFLLKNRIESWTQGKLADPSKTNISEDQKYQRAITFHILDKTRLEVEASGADYAIVVIPSRDELHERNLSGIEAIVSYCRRQSIPCLNLASVLQVKHYFPTDIHLTPAGHALVAEELFRFLFEASNQLSMSRELSTNNATNLGAG